jgi:NAD(P)-dependent dehydrogenase (short-subunit alcohol dehydrogenase family)
MKTVLITGASRGIGRATAEKFLKDGWRVIGTSTSGQLPFENKLLVTKKLDLADQISLISLAEELLKSGERIDVLINNAGIALDSHTVGADIKKVRQTFEVNLFGLIDFTERILSLIYDGGHIINIDSRYGSFAMPIDDATSVGYRMAKAALNMYTRSLAFRLKSQNTKVSSLTPGWVKTDMGYAAVTDDGETPDREPGQAADEIFKLATSDVESGQFWYKNKKTDW